MTSATRSSSPGQRRGSSRTARWYRSRGGSRSRVVEAGDKSQVTELLASSAAAPTAAATSYGGPRQVFVAIHM